MVVKYLVDTDILIDFLRGNAEAKQFVKEYVDIMGISSITVAELYSGVREGKEREYLDAFFNMITVLPVDNRIAVQGGLFRRDYMKSHGTGFADSIIAATSRIHGVMLCSLNRKHFPMIKNLKVPYKKLS